MLKQNKIKGSSKLNEPEIIILKRRHGLLSLEDEEPKVEKQKKVVDPKFEYLRNIRKNSRTVEIIDNKRH